MWETLLWTGGADPGSPPSFWLTAAGFATRAAWVGGLLLSFVVGLLWCFQEKLLFYPGFPQGFETPDKNPKGLRTPAERGMPYEELWIKTIDNLNLHSWLIKQKPASVAAQAPTIIFFHGNAGNVGFRLPNMELLYKHVGVNILILSYRGYGFSEGFPTEQGIYRDGEAALDTLRKKHKELGIDPEKIFLFGKSLGGAVAIDLAIKKPDQIRGVLVENTFTSLSDMVLIVFPFLRPVRRFVRIVQRLYMNNSEKVQHLQVPILFISGQKDELVPSLQMRTLFELCSSPLKEREDVPLGGHNDTWEWAIGGKAYYEKVRLFLRRALAYHQQTLQEPQAGASGVQKSAELQESAADKCAEKDDTLQGAGYSQQQQQQNLDDRAAAAAAAKKTGVSTDGRQVLPAELEPHTELPLSLSPADAAALTITGGKEARRTSLGTAAKDAEAAASAVDARGEGDAVEQGNKTPGNVGGPPADRASAALDAARVVAAAAAAASTTAARVVAGNRDHTCAVPDQDSCDATDCLAGGSCAADVLQTQDLPPTVTRRRGSGGSVDSNVLPQRT